MQNMERPRRQFRVTPAVTVRQREVDLMMKGLSMRFMPNTGSHREVLRSVRVVTERRRVDFTVKNVGRR